MPPVWFTVPDTFTGLDLGDDAGARVVRLVELTSSLTDEQRLHLVLAQELMIESLRRGHVVYAAHCLARSDGDPPRLSFAQFSVAARPVHLGADAALDVIAARLDAPGLRRAVGFVALRAGRALAVVEERRFSTEMTVLGRPRHREHTVRQVQLMVPFPGRRHLAVLALSTESLRDWDTYVEIMGAIARTVSFAPPGQGVSVAVEPVPGSITAALGDTGRSGASSDAGGPGVCPEQGAAPAR